MPLFGKRLPWESKEAVTIALRATRYRLTFRLPTATELDEYFFKHAIGTDEGKAERLQVLGFYNRPLDYDFARGGPGYTKARCLEVASFYYRRFYGLADDADITATLNQKILDYWLDDGSVHTLPPPDGFSRVRMPGGYNVFWPKGSPEAEAGRLGSGGASRYEIESAFRTANPRLGCVPIVVEVETKDSTTAWARAGAGVEIALSLVKPAKDLPSTNHVTPPAPRRGTLATYDSEKGTVLVAAARSDHGPWLYLKGRVVDYKPGTDGDPQKRNVDADLGGKRGVAVLGNVFKNGADFGARFAAPKAGADHTVLLDTDDRGLAVFVFSPSRVGGDRYKLQAEIGPKTQTADGKACNNVKKTGTMVVWRTIRVLHHIRVEPPTSSGDLDPTIAADVHTADWTCLHNAHITGRICVDCLKREGPLDWVDFTAAPKKEFAKAYCELEVDPSIKGGTYESMSDDRMKQALDRALAVVQNNAEVNCFDNTGEEPLTFILGDGTKADFGKRKVATKFDPGTVKLVFSTRGDNWKLLALHDPKTGTAGPPPSIVADRSSYAADTKTLTLVFSSAVDPSWDLQVEVQRPDRTVEKIKLDKGKLSGDGLQLVQTGLELRAGFKVLIAGVTVGRDQALEFSKESTQLHGDPAYSGPLAGAKANITFAKPPVVAIKFLEKIPEGVSVTVFGNGDDSGADGHANGFELFKGTGNVDGFRDVRVLGGLCKLDATWIKVGGVLVAKSDAAGNLVPESGAAYTVHKSSKVTVGAPAKAVLTFPSALTGAERIRLEGGGGEFLDGFDVDSIKDATTLTVNLPKSPERHKAKLKIDGTVVADDVLRFVVDPRDSAFNLTTANIDCSDGTLELGFDVAPPAGTRVGVHFKCTGDYFELSKLFYHPASGKKTPFLFNLHPSWAYNAVKSAKYGPLPMTSVHSGDKVKAKAGTHQSFTLTRTLREKAMRVDLGSDIWARPGSGLSGGPAQSRVNKGLDDEFDINVPEGITFTIKRKTAFTADQELTLHYQSEETKALERTAWADLDPSDGHHAVPLVVIQRTGKLLPTLLTEFFRQIEENHSFIPGLVFIQASLYDTLSCTWAGGAQVGLAQGPGSFLTGSRMFKKPYSYPNKEASEDTVQAGNTQVIGIHEICHSLFLQHAPTAGGNYPEEHDSKDTCLMSYDNSMVDFCGQCLTALRGMDYRHAQLKTV